MKIVWVSSILIILTWWVLYNNIFFKNFYTSSCASFIDNNTLNNIIWENEKTLFNWIENNGIEYSVDHTTCEGKVGIVFYVWNFQTALEIRDKISNSLYMKNIPYKIQNI